MSLTSGLVISGPIAHRTFTLGKKCETDQQHEHKYDHLTLVTRGRIKVFYEYEENGKTIKGESGEYGEDEFVTMKAGARHTVKALVDNTKYKCIFSHRDLDGIIIQSYNGNAGATE